MKKSSELNNVSAEELKERLVELQKKLDMQQLEIDGAKKTLQEASEYNVKLAYCARLFAELHLTKEEKTAIAQEFDRALSSEQVEKIYNMILHSAGEHHWKQTDIIIKTEIN